MKKVLLILSSVLTLSLFAADELPDLDWGLRNGKMKNWSGKMTPVNGGAVLKGRYVISYCMRKYLIGEKRKAQINFTVRGYSGGIGVYYYDKNGILLGRDQERIPNAENFKEFEAVFELPETAKGKKVASFRVYFVAPDQLEFKTVKMKLVD